MKTPTSMNDGSATLFRVVGLMPTKVKHFKIETLVRSTYKDSASVVMQAAQIAYEYWAEQGLELTDLNVYLLREPMYHDKGKMSLASGIVVEPEQEPKRFEVRGKTCYPIMRQE